MRFVCCTMAIYLLCGCQGNTPALRNPFATPNRVPPPATRVLQPGAAQPYYPGDRLPNTPGAVGAPAPAFQGTPGSVPPGGWNSSPHSSVTPTPNVVPASAQISLGPVAAGNEPRVQVNADQQNLRFAPLQAQEPSQALWNPPQAATASPATQVPSQLVLPSPNQPTQFSVQPAGFQTPVAPVQTVEQSGFAQASTFQAPTIPNIANRIPKEVRIRAVKPPRVDSASGSTAGVSQDGFRPQGSRLIQRSAPEPRSSATQQGVAPIQFGPVRENVDRFGFDPQYQWLRGQIQVSQATGQWHLRYIPVQGGPDQFGGQVLIENPHLLGGLQPGDFVQVRGRLNSQQNALGTSLPTYTVSIVQRQRVQ